MKRLVFLILIFLPFISYTQVITIYHQETNEPLELVALISEKPNAFATTNKKGQVDITSFKNAEKITIQLLGFQVLQKSYTELSSSSSIKLTQNSISMNEIVISATRWNQPQKDIPSKISSISAKDIQLQNPQTAADLLGTSGEVYIQKSQQGGGSPMIRGFATNRLLYTVDGVRMNTAIFRSGNIQNVISLDPFTMEHTEVFFGPGSVIYGSDAIGGVMSFQTLTPQLSTTDTALFTGKAVTRYSSANNEKTGHIDAIIGWKKFASTTSITFTDYGDLKMGSFGPDEYLRESYVKRENETDIVVKNSDNRIQTPSGYSQLNAMQKFRFKPNEKWNFEYGFHYSETSDYSRYDRHLRTKEGLPQYGEWYYGPQKWMMNTISIASSHKNILYDQLIIRLAHQFFEESRISRDFNKDDRETRTENVHAYSSNIDFNKTIGEKNNLFYGLEIVRNDVISSGINEDISTGTAINGPARYPNSDWSSYGVYLTNQHKFSKKIMGQVGVRYNQYLLNAKFDTTFYPLPFTEAQLNNGALTGSLGFVYRVNEKLTISINGANGFRSPNVDDIGKIFDSEPGAVVIPNPNLRSEIAYNGDMGIAKIIGNSVKVDVTGYYTLLKDALVRRDFTLNGQDSIIYDGTMSKVQAIQNAASANVYGVQMGIEIKLPLKLTFSSRFNYQQGEEELDDGSKSPSRHAPPWFGNSSITYKSKKLTIQLNTIYSGQKNFKDLPEEEKGKDYIYAIDNNGNPYSPSWYSINLKTLYQFTKVFSSTLAIENITDQRYKTYSSGIVSPGRNFVVSLRANF